MGQSTKLLARIAYWLLPAGIQNLGRKLAQTLTAPRVTPELNRLYERNAIFHNIHQNERCFILATGPSIKKQNLKPLKGEICFGLTMFFLHEDYQEIAPQYHVFVPNHPPYGNTVPEKYIGGLAKVISPRTTVFLGDTPYEHSFRNYLERNPAYKTDKMFFLNYYAEGSVINEENYTNPGLWDISKRPFSPRSVVYCAIQIAAYMGFKSIYLLGCDYDYLASTEKSPSRHFYDAEKGIDDSVIRPSTEARFLNYHLTWKQYRLMGEYLGTRGCQIYNATEGGMLDVFPSVTLNDVLAGKR